MPEKPQILHNFFEIQEVWECKGLLIFTGCWVREKEMLKGNKPTIRNSWSETRKGIGLPPYSSFVDLGSEVSESDLRYLFAILRIK